MSFIFSQYIYVYGYLAIFVFIYLQEVGIPIPLPNELLLLFSGFLVFKHVMSLSIVLLVAVTADFCGTMTLYFIFYFFGERLMSHRPKWFPISSEKLDRLRMKLAVDGWLAVYFCRIIPFIRGYTSVAAGLLRLSRGKYAWVALGSSALVCTAYIMLGFIFGPYYSTIAARVAAVKVYLLLSLLLLAVLFAVKTMLSIFKGRAMRKDRKQYQNNEQIRLHVVSETAWVTKGQGVHTAYVELNELLHTEQSIKINVNEEGTGNIFHSHTYGPYYFWKGLRYKGRRILTAHVIPDSSRGTIPFWRILLPLTTRYLKMAYSFADVVVAISPTVESALKQLNIKSKIVRIYNPVLLGNWERSPENRSKGRQLLGIKTNERMVLGVGQLQERKGVEDFIDMATAMPGTKFVWVGGRPWGAFTEGVSRINSRIASGPPNLTFTGLLELEDMPPMYAAADVFLFPSYQENCPLAPLEAAASGLPVVFRDIPEYRSLFTLPYLKAANTQEFIQVADRLLYEDEYYNYAVGLSRQLTGLFDKEKIKNQFIELYRGTLDDCFKTNTTNPGRPENVINEPILLPERYEETTSQTV